MALITRCPVCGTRFKVVPDQLRISDGWVRCGECAEVFDASADLTQSEAEPLLAPWQVDGSAGPERAAAPWSQEPTPGGSAEDPATDNNSYGAGYGTGYVWSALPTAEAAPPSPSGSSFVAPFQPVFDTPSTAPADPPPHADQGFEPASKDEGDRDVLADDIGPAFAPWDPAFDDPVDDRPETPEPKARHESEDDGGEVAQSLTEFPADMSTLPEDTVYVAPPPAAEVDAALEERPVSFLKDAVAPAETRWQKPWMQRSLGVLAALLLLALGVQAAVQQRDHIAASLPAARPVLQALCAPFGCTVEPLRQIESIVIDSSTFTTVRHGNYRLNVVLKNRAATEIAVPAIELALTDTQEQPVLRRVLLPADMVAAPGNIAAGGEWTASMELAVVDEASIARIVGYRLLAFYP